MILCCVCTLWHLASTIIDGQGQRACRSHSAQAECDGSTQSDRATRCFLTAFTFRAHFARFRASRTGKSHREAEVELKEERREKWGGDGRKYIFFWGPKMWWFIILMNCVCVCTCVHTQWWKITIYRAIPLMRLFFLHHPAAVGVIMRTWHLLDIKKHIAQSGLSPACFFPVI